MAGKRRKLKLKGKNALNLRKSARDADTLWTTPWDWRDEDDTYVGHNGQVWLYRAMPVEPLEWEDPATRLAVGQNFATMLAEIGGLASAPIGALKTLANNREIHVVSVVWEGPVKPPEGNGKALYELQRNMLEFTAPKKALIVGVRLRGALVAGRSSVVDQALSVASKVLTEDVPDREAYERDRLIVAGICGRYGGRRLLPEERAQLESWSTRPKRSSCWTPSSSKAPPASASPRTTPSRSPH